MASFIVPIEKDSQFSIKFFKILSDNLAILHAETDQWPDQILFSGRLGKELFEYYQKAGWDLKQFNPAFEGTTEKITFQYSKPLTIIEDNNAPIMDSSMGENMMKGIPSEKTMRSIVNAYSSSTLGLKKERTIRPTRWVLLARGK